MNAIATAAPADSPWHDADSMAALGRLAAGIAHEINNPLTFIGCNLRCMEIYAGELLHAAEANPPGGAAAPDLAYLRQDIPALFAETAKGIRRIADIVQDLHSFSQLHHADRWDFADPASGLDSALQLLDHDIGPGLRIVRETGELPRIRCQIGQLAQVFHNLLANAIRAVGGNGTIWLRSGGTPAEVWLEIADNGCGVAPEHLPHIFEPFFTTRPVGQGTGLGLFVACGIVRRHGGRLTVASRQGGGSIFRITLPVLPAGAVPMR